MVLRGSRFIYIALLMMHLGYFVLHAGVTYPILSKVRQNTVEFESDTSIKEIVSMDSGFLWYEDLRFKIDYPVDGDSDLVWCRLGEGVFYLEGVSFGVIESDRIDFIDEEGVGKYSVGEILWMVRVSDGSLLLERNGVREKFADGLTVYVEGDSLVVRGLRAVSFADVTRVQIRGSNGVKGYSVAGGALIEGVGSLAALLFGEVYVVMWVSFCLMGYLLWKRSYLFKFWCCSFGFFGCLFLVLFMGV